MPLLLAQVTLVDGQVFAVANLSQICHDWPKLKNVEQMSTLIHPLQLGSESVCVCLGVCVCTPECVHLFVYFITLHLMSVVQSLCVCVCVSVCVCVYISPLRLAGGHAVCDPNTL